MSNYDVQNIISNCIAGLLTDADEARDYGNDPHGYLANKLDGYDVAGIDMAAAVREASAEADLPADMATAVNDAVYQPAPTVRVQRPDDDEKKYDEKKYDEEKYGDNYDEDPYDTDNDGRDDRYDEPDAPTPPKGWEPEGVEEYEGYRPDPTDVLDTDDLPPVKVDKYDEPDYADVLDTDDLPPVRTEYPTLDERPVNREYDNEAPRYEQMDNGGYRAELPQDWDHNAYTPDNYGHEGPMDLDCVEYSVSNCVTTAYGDTPEIADAICENRNWDDPYDRHDESHEFADMRPTEPYVEEAHVEQPYAEQDLDRPMYDEDRDVEPVREERYEEERYEAPVRDDRYDADRHDDMADEDCDELDEQRMPEQADAHYDAPQAEADYGQGYETPEAPEAMPEADDDYGQGYDAPEAPEAHDVEYQAPAEVHEAPEYDDAPVYVEPEIVVETPVHVEPDSYEAPVDEMAMDMEMAAPAEEMMID